MFINCSNHSSDKWSVKQLNAAKVYGEIVDISFPNVSPSANKQEIISMASELLAQIVSLKPNAVMCQGEFTLTFALVKMLQEKEITVLSACSERQSVDVYKDDGSTERRAVFEFAQFREYI